VKFKITYAQVMCAERDFPTIEDAAKHAKLVVGQFPKDELKVLSIYAMPDT
jgi:hypothetical protein